MGKIWGLEDDKHNNPANVLNEIDLFELFASNQNLMNKLKSYFDKKKEQQNQKSSTDDKNNNNSISNFWFTTSKYKTYSDKIGEYWCSMLYKFNSSMFKSN